MRLGLMPRPAFPDVSPTTRKVMQANKGKDTKPEMVVRRLAHGMGYRYRLHRKDLPGKPDLVFGPRRAVVQVYGCFWHQHEGCRHSHIPKTRREFWVPKLARNVERDRDNEAKLRAVGWRVLVLWECETRDGDAVATRIGAFLGPPGRDAPQSG